MEAPRKADQIEIDKTFAEFGKCLTTWANVEYALLFVFQEALGRPNLELISGAFYSIENLRSKISAVDAVVSTILKDSDILSKWSGNGGLLNRLQSKAKTRNALAHAGAVYYSDYTKDGRRHLHLGRPTHDPKAKKFDHGKPVGGYNLNNLVFIEREFHTLLNDLSDFAMLLERPAKRYLKSARPTRHLLRVRNLYDPKRTKPKAPPAP